MHQAAPAGTFPCHGAWEFPWPAAVILHNLRCRLRGAAPKESGVLRTRTDEGEAAGLMEHKPPVAVVSNGARPRGKRNPVRILWVIAPSSGSMSRSISTPFIVRRCG